MTSGFCGRNVKWWLKNGKLTIRGKGAMEDYFVLKQSPPWYEQCNAIKKAFVGYGVTTISSWTFSGCTNLTSLKIPASVTTIGIGAFGNCSSLMSVIIPASVTNIGIGAFGKCNNLTSLTIPNSVTIIDYGAFTGCSSLKNLTIPEGITIIGDLTFSDCSSLISVIIPEGVTTIGEWAFKGCSSLKDIIIPKSVKIIGRGAFWECSSLIGVKIPKGVETINDAAFYNCSSLTSATIPDSVTSIGEQIFLGCDNLKRIFYPAGRGFEKILSAENNAKLIPYTAEQSAKERKFFPVVEPAPEKLRWKVEGKTLTVGGVREIKFYSYGELPWVESVDAIQHIVIEAGVEKISANAFSECKRLELLTIPASVKIIGDCAFTFCFCGNRAVNGGKNVLWSLDDGILTFKKNPDVRNANDFTIGAVSWRAVDKNITGVKIERGVIPDKKFFDWRNGLSRDVPISM